MYTGDLTWGEEPFICKLFFLAVFVTVSVLLVRLFILTLRWRRPRGDVGYLLEICRTDARMGKNASTAIFLLSIAVAAYAAFPIFSYYFENHNSARGSYAIFRTGQQSLFLIGTGWLSGVMLYSVAISVEWLSARRAASRKREPVERGPEDFA